MLRMFLLIWETTGIPDSQYGPLYTAVFLFPWLWLPRICCILPCPYYVWHVGGSLCVPFLAWLCSKRLVTRRHFLWLESGHWPLPSWLTVLSARHYCYEGLLCTCRMKITCLESTTQWTFEIIISCCYCLLTDFCYCSLKKFWLPRYNNNNDHENNKATSGVCKTTMEVYNTL